jgi:hypothetical protein
MKRVTGIGGIFFKAKDARHCRPGTSGTSESISRNGVARLSRGPTVKVSQSPEQPPGPSSRRRPICAQRCDFHGQLPGGGSPRPR